ncbi:MAG: ABC transporter permease, partial [Chloroflexi bacterium]
MGAAQLPLTGQIEKEIQHRSFWSDARRRFSKNRLATLGLVTVVLLLFIAIFANFLAPHPYDKADFLHVLTRPFTNPQYILGTDEVGRDFLSRLIYGARTSIAVGLCVQLIALGLGMPMGALAGYRGGVMDFIVTRLIDIMTAFPGLLFAIFLVTVWGGGIGKVILVLGITSWIGIARLTRAQFIALREREYIEAARCIGADENRILFKHILPNALSPIIVAVSFGIPAAIFGEAGLSFLGIGINDPLPSWGKMVGVSNAYIGVYWHMALFPTL